MSDEQVDIKVSADNTAALSALEQIASALQKMGDKVAGIREKAT